MLKLGVRQDILSFETDVKETRNILNSVSTIKVQVLERYCVIMKLAPLYSEWN